MTGPIRRRTVLKGLGVAAAGLAAGPLLRPAGAAAAVSGVDDATMRGLYEELVTPFPYGVVLPTPPGAGLVDSPGVFRGPDGWCMLHVVFRDGGYETVLATSPDLLSWTPRGTVLPFRDGAWDARQAAGYPALQDPVLGGSHALRSHDGAYWLSYIGGATPGYEAGELAIGVARTDDPARATPWVRFDAPVLRPGDADARPGERSKLFKSNVVEDPDRRLGGRFVMHYNATPNPGFDDESIYAAVSDDMRTWRRVGSGPAVPAPGAGLDVVNDPQVLRVGDVWVMVVGYALQLAPRGFFDSFWASTDLVSWTPWTGPALVSGSQPYSAREAYKPWVVRDGGTVYHFHHAIDDTGAWSIALSTSRDLRGDATVGGITASASHTYPGDSPREAVDGVVSYGADPENRWTAWDSPNSADWLGLDFAARSASGLRLHVYDDGGGVQPPRSYAVEFRDGAGAWRPVDGPVRSPAEPVAGLNTATFAPVTTTGLRIWFTHRNGGATVPGEGVYSGVTEVEILG